MMYMVRYGSLLGYVLQYLDLPLLVGFELVVSKINKLDHGWAGFVEFYSKVTGLGLFLKLLGNQGSNVE